MTFGRRSRAANGFVIRRRHPHTYRRPKPVDEALADLERALDGPENVTSDDAPRRELPPTDYRPIIAVIAIVIFSLAMIAFVFTLRAR
jgi:hypothetical protein